ncbi:flagellar hook-associated protein FlgK [Rheinheimera salexigens]|uniref:Flagellar hook-associated protein 1 n=1 Tax=Rheinheimera salexigens TaxID=1628148 RepID=A0A1E7Q7Y8_9GAMM|nr:flagellar hook-associated protein FlgK [Rheinheimera salexigens]OEY70305.1 flagellar hook-associated protein FlgK [Rheinheimera salexigens]
MSDNLLRIGTSAVLANSSLLNTTSNNIANINTPGYVRQRTEFESQQFGLGVGRGTTERLVSEFTQKQMRRDTSNLAFSAQFVSEANRVDSLFSNPANSIATGMNDLFAQIQTANNDPTQLSNRQLIIGSSQALVDRFDGMSNLILDQEKYVNQQLDIYVNEANDLIKQVASYNKEIASFGTGASRPVPLDLLDKRDHAILKLSEMMEVTTLDSANGEKLVFMTGGQSLVVEQGNFQLFTLRGEPDPNRKELQLKLNSKNSVVRNVNVKEIGGKLGAVVAFREEILDPAQRQLGQLALTIADSMNSQNKLGMTLNGTIGKDLFTLPEFKALNFNGAAGSINYNIEPGKSGQLPPNDFKVTINSTIPGEVLVQALDTKGNVIEGSDILIPGLDFSSDVTINSKTLGLPGGEVFGLEMTISSSAAVGDKYLLSPLSSAARQLDMATNRPEDIALASPVRGTFNNTNLGNGRVESLTVTSTVTSPDPFLDNAPYTLTYTDNNEFEITDKNSTLLGTATFSTNNYNNILENTVPAGLADTLGFDFNISGQPKLGDSFSLEFNQDGINDNRNGLAFAELQNAATTRRTADPTTSAAINKYSFNQTYATMVGSIGERTRQARTSEEANSAILSQTTQWYESLSGVSLDEEAANLVRFQQSYAAASKIISTSQTIFDTLLQAVR